MRYDFDEIIPRRNTNSYKWDSAADADVLPLWVADMDFRTAAPIVEALQRRVAHGIFGYTRVPDAYYDAVTDWFARRHGWAIRRDWMIYTSGVVPALSAVIKALTVPGDKVLVQTPVYNCFFSSIRNNGCGMVSSPLTYEDRTYRMDFEDLERKAADEQVKVMLLCNPHNPCGRVWEPWEIEKAMEIYRKHDVYVISDEIWSDIILEGHKHTPTQSVSEDARQRTVALYAPSKTFNLAGLVGSYHIVYNKWLRDRMVKESSLCHYNEMNVLSMHALIGAYGTEGHLWVDELRQVITENVNFACSYIDEHFEGVSVSKPEGTYMLFVDCTDWCTSHGKTIDDVEKAAWRVGVAVQDGRMFHGPCHLRFNLALPLSRVKEAFERLDRYVFNTGQK